MTPVNELLSVWEELDGDAREVFLLIARRLSAGQKQYGRMNVSGDGRDYLEEIMMELVDAPVYGAMEFVKKRRQIEQRDKKEFGHE